MVQFFAFLKPKCLLSSINSTGKNQFRLKQSKKFPISKQTQDYLQTNRKFCLTIFPFSGNWNFTGSETQPGTLLWQGQASVAKVSAYTKRIFASAKKTDFLGNAQNRKKLEHNMHLKDVLLFFSFMPLFCLIFVLNRNPICAYSSLDKKSYSTMAKVWKLWACPHFKPKNIFYGFCENIVEENSQQV